MNERGEEPISTEGLRCGRRAVVAGIGTPGLMRAPEALAVSGPRAFGLGVRFRPVEDLVPG